MSDKVIQDYCENPENINDVVCTCNKNLKRIRVDMENERAKWEAATSYANRVRVIVDNIIKEYRKVIKGSEDMRDKCKQRVDDWLLGGAVNAPKATTYVVDGKDTKWCGVSGPAGFPGSSTKPWTHYQGGNAFSCCSSPITNPSTNISNSNGKLNGNRTKWQKRPYIFSKNNKAWRDLLLNSLTDAKKTRVADPSGLFDPLDTPDEDIRDFWQIGQCWTYTDRQDHYPKLGCHCSDTIPKHPAPKSCGMKCTARGESRCNTSATPDKRKNHAISATVRDPLVSQLVTSGAFNRTFQLPRPDSAMQP